MEWKQPGTYFALQVISTFSTAMTKGPPSKLPRDASIVAFNNSKPAPKGPKNAVRTDVSHVSVVARCQKCSVLNK